MKAAKERLQKELLQRELKCPLSIGMVISACQVAKCAFWDRDLEKGGDCLVIRMMRNLGQLKKR